MKWPLAARRVYCWLWDRLHGYPRGSISEDGTVITLSTGKCPDYGYYHEYAKRRRLHDLHLNENGDPAWPDTEEE